MPLPSWQRISVVLRRGVVRETAYYSRAEFCRMAPSTESIHGHSTGRWLYNDKEQRALRHTPFDVEALKQVTCQSVGATRCSQFTKLGEGSYNKIFLLELDNGVKATARIPSKAVGNLELATASEAATLTYFRDSNRAIVPKVLAWNASFDANPVKWPYIVTEYVPGWPLQDKWLKMRGTPVASILVDLLTHQILVSSPEFSQIGSLYFKADVSPELQARPLYALEEHNIDDPDDISQKYRIGPVANREWWRGELGGVDSDRGPWPDTASFIGAAARLQLRYISNGPDFQSSFPRSRRDDIPELQKLLERCVAASPYLAPTESFLAQPTIDHPDLSASNIIVSDEEVNPLCTIIDWQGTVVAPFFMQATIPPAVAYTAGVIELPDDGSMPSFPVNMDQFSAEKQENLRLHYTLACRHRYFVLKAEADERFPLAWSLPQWELMRRLPLYICRAWASGPPQLRQALISLEEIWPELSTDPCPFRFTAEERASHKTEFADMSFYLKRVDLLTNLLGSDADGWVRNEDFDESRRLMEEVKQQWDPEKEKGPFPFEERMYSYFLT